MRKIRVAFVFEDLDSNWLGGLNYFLNLINSAAKNSDSGVEVVLFSGAEINDFGFPLDLERVEHKMLKRGSVFRLIRKIIERVTNRDVFLNMLLRRHGIDMLSHSYASPQNFKIPAVPWIPDFQHKRLPEMFQESEVKRRDSLFSKVINYPGDLILSSHSAAADCDKFFPERQCKIHVLRFVSGPPIEWVPLPIDELKKKYALPDFWFHLPNQYWKHKNHAIVAAALGDLKRNGIIAPVVSTGNTKYKGDSKAFDSVVDEINKHGVDEREFIILGPIPYGDMLSVMYHSLAIINPSRFEGWSTSVEEGKSMGKNIILSTIDVHLEQCPEHAFYFDPDDFLSLAAHMKKIIETNEPRLDCDWTVKKKEFESRWLKFGSDYCEIVKKIVKG